MVLDINLATGMFPTPNFMGMKLGSNFFNQARAGHRPARACFPNIDPVRTSVCACVCVSAPEAINNQWRDMAWYGP